MNVKASEVLDALAPAASIDWKQRLRSLASSEIAIWAGVSCLFLMLPLVLIKHATIGDPDIWWHLRAGEWMIQHGSIIRFDPFSASTLGKPWAEYSWLFDVVADWIVTRADLVSVIWFEVGMAVAVTAALFTLVRSLMPQFWGAVGITAAAMFAISMFFQPRPLTFSCLFLILEIYLLLRAKRTGDSKLLWSLPALFLLWVNIHIEFVNGLFVLGVFCIEPLIDIACRVPQAMRTPIDTRNRRLWFVLAACVAATLINPYGVGVYRTVLSYAHDSKILNVVMEMHAMQFRYLNDWFVLALTMMGCFALGRIRPFRPLWAVLLAWAAWMSFRAMREADLVVIFSVAIIALRWGQEEAGDHASYRLGTQMRFAVGLAIVVALVAAAAIWPFSSQKLLSEVGGQYPLAAAKNIRKNNLQGPLLNEFSWGGFLIYALPEIPVAMDGRVNVHGQDNVLNGLSLWKGEEGWQSRPELENANLVIGSRAWPLTGLLRSDPRFKLIYEDPLAVLFQRVDPQSVVSPKNTSAR